MSVSLKRFALRAFIVLVRGAAVTIYYLKRFARAIGAPLGPVGKVLVRAVGVPVYRAVFFVRRMLGRLYVPGRNKLMYLLTNRYAIHAIVAVLVVATTAMSVQASGVRADDFGQESTLYHLVTGQENEVVAVRADTVASVPVRYLGSGALSGQTNIDFHSPDDDYVTVTSGAVIIAPTIAKARESTAPRTETVEYTVQSGDTLGTIAESYGLSINTLLWANGLSVRSTIRPGDSLRILPLDGLMHTVKSGDTVLAIAKKYGAEAEKIVDFNHLASAGDLQIGTSLVVPGGKPPVVAPARQNSSIGQVLRTPGTSVTTAPAGSPTGSGRMLWPTDMRVITQYFTWKHTGVDIDCKFTNDNYAADDGYVQYSGWKGGYGLTVEINHGNGIVTRYGHHAKLYVTAGQQISKGTPIGLCGTTGKSSGTHLHFEVITGGRFRNPLEYIR